MNHQPFRDWLVTDDHLTPEQDQLLHEHLSECASCQQVKAVWTDVEALIQKAPSSEPQPGFSERWHAHLAAYQARRHKQRAWTSIGVLVLFMLSLLGVGIYQIGLMLQAPGIYLLPWFSHLLNLASIYFLLQQALHSFTGLAPVYAFLGVFFLVGLFSFNSVLWLATYKRLTLARRLA